MFLIRMLCGELQKAQASGAGRRLTVSGEPLNRVVFRGRSSCSYVSLDFSWYVLHLLHNLYGLILDTPSEPSDEYFLTK